MTAKSARLIAFYLPQFHPISENDAWWGKGFTEWTNVARAKPLFPGHYQPHLPADLGFYDLRVPETRIAQAEMARQYGIEAFCYWHYWFAGRQLLDRPFKEVLRSGEPDFPFCLAWANQSWTGIWHGAPNRILIEQTYPGIPDHVAHFYALMDAFGDARYLTIDGKPLFLVYKPYDLPEPLRFTDVWRELALKCGLPGLYLVGVADPDWMPTAFGFDAAVLDSHWIALKGAGYYDKGKSMPLLRNLTGQNHRFFWNWDRPFVYRYDHIIKYALPPLSCEAEQYPCLIPSWDNTPRSGTRGVVWHASGPEVFRKHCRAAIAQVGDRRPEQRMVFIKSWNEWAEGNHLEPDCRFGRAYLEVVRDEVHAQ